MTIKARLRAPLLVAAGALSMFSAACADPSAGDSAASARDGVGSLGLALELAPDVVLETIDYQITGVGFALEGTLQVPGKGVSFAATIADIPVGVGHQLRLSSRALGDAGLACVGSATFDVAQSATTQVNVVLLCDVIDNTGAATINGSFNVCPSVTSTTISPVVQTVGGTIALGIAARDVDRAPSPISYTWASDQGTVSNATTTAPTFTCTTPGPVTIRYAITDGSCSKSGSVSATCVPAGGDASRVVINEVESNGGTPGDWVELYNPGSAPVDLSGFFLKDNDDTRMFKLAAGTVLAANSYLVVEEAQFGYGLGSGDAARLYRADGTTLIDSYSWTVHASSTYGRCPDGSGPFVQTPSSKGTVNVCSTVDAGLDAGVVTDAGTSGPRTVVINEVESNGGDPGDWAELYNTGSAPVDVSGWAFKDNDDTRTFKIAAGSVIAPGAYLVVEEAQFGFGLGAADATRLYTSDGTTLVDSYSWTAHATSTYGRCPNGSGAFQQTASSKGATNRCDTGSSDAGTDAGAADAGAADAGSTGLAWPGAAEVVTVDPLNAYAGNLSGLSYEAGATAASSVLWAVQNGPSMLYRLQADSSGLYTSSTLDGWAAGKQLLYPSGTGVPDAEGVAVVPSGSAGLNYLYVSTERDNNVSNVSRLSVLVFDPSASTTTLTASREWNLTSDLPAVGANLGLEAITFVSDAELAAQAFREGNGLPYNATRFAQHGGGIFLVGVEGTGMIHVYALNHADGTFLRLSSFSSGMPGVMDLDYDAATNYLWAYGDDTQNNTTVLFEIEQNMASMSYGQFVQRKVYARPSGLPNVNNEGITFAPESECLGGFRAFFWADDSNTGGHSLRRGSIPCGKSY